MSLWTTAAARPDITALVAGDERIRFGELAARTNRIAKGLRRAGCKTGDTVALMLGNGAPLLEHYLAAMQIGLYVAPLSPELSSPELARLLTASEARVLITESRLGEVARTATEGGGLDGCARFAVGGAEGFRSAEELLEGPSDEPPGDRRAGALLRYRSGERNGPDFLKPATEESEAGHEADHDPDRAADQAGLRLARFGITAEDPGVHLCCSPLDQTAPLEFATLSLHLGHSLVVMEGFDAEELLALVEHERVSHTLTLPDRLAELYALPEALRATYDLTTLERVVLAAPCPAALERQAVDWLGPVLRDGGAAIEDGGSATATELSPN